MFGEFGFDTMVRNEFFEYFDILVEDFRRLEKELNWRKIYVFFR